MKRPSVEDRFWSKVTGGDVESCWEWTGGRTPQGYGRFVAPVNGKPKTFAAHRVAYHLLRAEILDQPRWHLDHECSNPPCVNPWHLDVVNWQANTLRAVERGRWRNITMSPDQYRTSAHGTPQYHRVIETIRGELRSGVWAPGDRFLTADEIRQRYPVTTVASRAVLEWLKAEGLVRGQPGEAVYVTGGETSG